MAGRGRKFKFHGAYKSKSAARSKEKSEACDNKCFILPRKIRGGRRFVVLERR